MPGKITMRNPYIKRLPERPQGIQTEVIEHFMTSRRKVGKYIATSLHKKKKLKKRTRNSCSNISNSSGYVQVKIVICAEFLEKKGVVFIEFYQNSYQFSIL